MSRVGRDDVPDAVSRSMTGPRRTWAALAATVGAGLALIIVALGTAPAVSAQGVPTPSMSAPAGTGSTSSTIATTTTAKTPSTTSRPAPTPTSTVPATASRDLAYGDEPWQRLDAFVPQDNRTDRPAIVLVHGGGWTGGDKGDVGPTAQAFAENGFVSFSVSYGLQQEPRWPNQVEDVRLAVRWVQDNADSYGLDAKRVGIFGSSAGGNLAMLVATGGTGDGHPPVKALTSWSGPSDLTTLTISNLPGDVLASPPTVPIPGAETPPGCAGNEACLGMIGSAFIQAYMDCTLSECPEQYIDASPAFAATTETPPMFLVGAATDLVPFEQNLEMANALMNQAVASELMLVAGEEHADSYASTALAPTIDFFTRYLVNGADPRTKPNAPPSVAAGSLTLPELDPAGRFAVPGPPPAAAPRTGIIGYFQRNIRGFGWGALVVGLVAAIVVVAMRRRGTTRRRA